MHRQSTFRQLEPTRLGAMRAPDKYSIQEIPASAPSAQKISARAHHSLDIRGDLAHGDDKTYGDADPAVSKTLYLRAWMRA